LDAQKGKEKANNKEKSQVWSQLLAVTNGRCRHKYKIKKEMACYQHVIDSSLFIFDDISVIFFVVWPATMKSYKKPKNCV
jgi:hypothetical protein